MEYNNRPLHIDYIFGRPLSNEFWTTHSRHLPARHYLTIGCTWETVRFAIEDDNFMHRDVRKSNSQGSCVTGFFAEDAAKAPLAACTPIAADHVFDSAAHLVLMATPRAMGAPGYVPRGLVPQNTAKDTRTQSGRSGGGGNGGAGNDDESAQRRGRAAPSRHATDGAPVCEALRDPDYRCHTCRAQGAHLSSDCPNLQPGAPDLYYGMPLSVPRADMRRADRTDPGVSAGFRIYVDVNDAGARWFCPGPSDREFIRAMQ
jgi:hypothetical protein